MSQLSYVSTPLPANGQPRSASALAAIFSNIQTAHNDTDTTVANAASAATASVLVKRGSIGEAYFGYLIAQPAAASGSVIVEALAPNTHTGALFLGAYNGVTKYSVDVSGNGTFLGSLITGSSGVTITTADGHLDFTKGANVVPVTNGGTGAAALAGHGAVVMNAGGTAQSVVAPGSANNLLVSNGTDWTSAAFSVSLIPDSALPARKLSDFALSTNASAMTVSIAAGKYVDSAGTSLVYGGGTATFTSAPTAPNTRYDAVSLAPGGTVVVTQGGDATYGHVTDTGNPPTTRPNVPPANALLGYVLIPSGGGVIPSGNIDNDWRTPVGGSGAGSGGGGASTSYAYITNGDLHTGGSLPNSLDINAVLAGTSTLGSGLALVGSGTNSGKLDGVLATFIQPDLPARLSWSGSAMTLQAGSGGSGPTGTPYTLAAYGASGTRIRTVTANVTVSGTLTGAGTKYLIADLSGAGPGFTMTWSTSAAVGAYQVLLAKYYYDGTTLQQTLTSFTPMGAINSNQVAQMHVVVNDTGNDGAFTSTAAFTKPTNMARTTFYLPEPANVLVLQKAQGFYSMTESTGVSAGVIEFYAAFDDLSSPINCAYMEINPTLYATVTGGVVQGNWTQNGWHFLQLAAGTHTITQVAHTTAPMSSDLYRREVRLLVMGAW